MTAPLLQVDSGRGGEDMPDSRNVADWVQIVSGIALVVGIALVIYELRQARELAEAQAINEIYSALVSENLAMIGENAADVFARACDDPKSLSSADLRVMEALMWNRLIRVSRRDTESGWAGLAESAIGSIFSVEFGRNWWKTTRSFWPSDIAAVGDRLLESAGPTSCKAFYDGLRNGPPVD